MELFKGKILQRKGGGEVFGDKALEDKVTALLFSAGWCPPCRLFVPLLSDMYEELKNRFSQFEVVFVSSDKTEKDMEKFVQEDHADWLCIPFGDPLIKHMKEKFEVNAVPKLIIVKPNGDVITWKGRKEVQDRGITAYRTWFDHSGLDKPKSYKDLTKTKDNSENMVNDVKQSDEKDIENNYHVKSKGETDEMVNS